MTKGPVAVVGMGQNPLGKANLEERVPGFWQVGFPGTGLALSGDDPNPSFSMDQRILKPTA